MSCSIVLNGLLRDCTPSVGGVKRVVIANYSDVSGKTLTDDKVSAITLAEGAKFKEYAIRTGSASLTKTATLDNANGVSYVTSDLALQFNRMDTTKRTEIAALYANELVVLVQDNNNVWWYLGYDRPVVASAGDGATGQAMSDANKYGITLQANDNGLPYEVDATIVDALIG